MHSLFRTDSASDRRAMPLPGTDRSTPRASLSLSLSLSLSIYLSTCCFFFTIRGIQYRDASPTNGTPYAILVLGGVLLLVWCYWVHIYYVRPRITLGLAVRLS